MCTCTTTKIQLSWITFFLFQAEYLFLLTVLTWSPVAQGNNILLIILLLFVSVMIFIIIDDVVFDCQTSIIIHYWLLQYQFTQTSNIKHLSWLTPICKYLYTIYFYNTCIICSLFILNSLMVNRLTPLIPV